MIVSTQLSSVRRRRLLASVAFAAALLAGCGDDMTATAPVEATASSAADPSTSAPDSAPAGVADAVTVTRTGGIAGERETFRVTAEDPLADKVLPLTDDPSVFEGLPQKGSAPCCDFYLYEVVVAYPDGRDYRFVTWQAADVPPEVDRLVQVATATR